MQKFRRTDLGKVALLALLAAVAVFAWTAPARQERWLRRATLDQLQARIRQRPTEDRAHYYLGLRLRQAGQTAAAVDSFRKAAELRPSQEDVWLAWADTVQAGDRQKAYDLLQVFLRDFPDSVRARTKLASLYLSDQDFLQAYREARAATAVDPGAELAWRLAGRAAINRSQADRAEEAMRKALELNPGSWENRAGLGNALALRRRWDEALALYDEAAAAAPKEALPHYLKGTVLLARAVSEDDLLRAVAEFEQAIRFEPGLPLAYRGLGLALSRLKRWDKARLALEEARSRDPQNGRVAFALARVYRELNLPQEARRESQRHARLQAYHQEKQTLYEKIEALEAGSPEEVPLRHQLAALMTRNQDELGAIDQYRKILRRQPGETQARALMLGLQRMRPATLDEAQALLLQRQYRQAEAAFLTVLQRDKENALALEGMAVALKEQDKEQGAYLYALEAARRKPDLAVSQRMLGDLYARANYYQEAAFHFQKAVDAWPDDALSWHRLGNVLREVTGKDAEAVRAFQQAIALQPDDPYVRLDLAEALAAMRKRTDAEGAFREALRIAPDNESVLARFGAFLIETTDTVPERREEAARLLARALQIDPSDAFARYQMARITDDPARAIPMLEEVLQKASGREMVEVWYTLSKAYRRAGDLRRAKEAVAVSARIQADYIAYTHLQEKILLRPRDPALRLAMARAFAARGENAKALQEYERCLLLAPKDPRARREKEQLTRRLIATGKMPDMDLFRRMVAVAQTAGSSRNRPEGERK